MVPVGFVSGRGKEAEGVRRQGSNRRRLPGGGDPKSLSSLCTTTAPFTANTRTPPRLPELTASLSLHLPFVLPGILSLPLNPSRLHLRRPALHLHVPLGCPLLPDQEREGRLPSSPIHTFVLFALTSLTGWNYSLSYSCLPYRPVSHWKRRNPPGAGAEAQGRRPSFCQSPMQPQRLEPKSP